MLADTQMLQTDDAYLEERGCLILRTLCKFMNAETVLSQLATIISVRRWGRLTRRSIPTVASQRSSFRC